MVDRINLALVREALKEALRYIHIFETGEVKKKRKLFTFVSMYGPILCVEQDNGIKATSAEKLDEILSEMYTTTEKTIEFDKLVLPIDPLTRAAIRFPELKK